MIIIATQTKTQAFPKPDTRKINAINSELFPEAIFGDEELLAMTNTGKILLPRLTFQCRELDTLGQEQDRSTDRS